MAIVNTHYGFCAKGGAAVKFTYTGEYNVRDDGVVELLTSGTLVFLANYVIDRFMVGGGSAGGSPNNTNYSAASGLGGGAGGHTRTDKGIAVTEGTPINITIGRGGTAAWGTASGRYATWTAGEATTWGADSVPGGNGGNVRNINDGRAGRSGGSGGGSGAMSTTNVGIGGTDGGNGGDSTGAGGAGQGTTTREFGEDGGKLYAAGGGGGTMSSAQTPVYAQGGEGGGGAGAWSNGGAAKQAASAGMANTGSGGGGGCLVFDQGQQVMGGSGASGIVCFRAAHELPELAGTWVLNERLYAPESNTAYNGSATITNTDNKNRNVTYVGATTAVYSATLTNGNNFTLYNFATNKWTNDLGKNTKVTFPAGATAPEEFRAWLASNATKQS